MDLSPDMAELKREPEPLESVVLLLCQAVDTMTEELGQLRSEVVAMSQRLGVDEVDRSFASYDSQAHALPRI